MRPHILLSIIIVFVQMTTTAQQNLENNPTEDIAMVSSTMTYDHPESNRGLPKASFMQGDLEVIPLESDESCTVKVSAFPNPIKQNITLLTFGNRENNLELKLSSGDQILVSKKIANSKESINVADFDGDNYILTISISNRELKTFKIIKH